MRKVLALGSSASILLPFTVNWNPDEIDIDLSKCAVQCVAARLSIAIATIAGVRIKVPGVQELLGDAT